MNDDSKEIFGTHLLKTTNGDMKSDLASMAYEQLKKAILFDELHVGDMLSENSLAQSMNMSRTPVREAFRRLNSEGLIVIIPGRGAFVKPITLPEQHDIYELRVVLECHAVKTAVNNIKAEELEQVEQIWQDMLDQVEKGEEIDWVYLVIQDQALHSMILDNCSNKQVAKVMQNVSMMNFRYMLYAAKALNSPVATIRQHLEIIDLMKKKDADKLCGVLKEHIWNSERDILDGFKQGTNG